jgi:hypothetical protein
VNVYADHNFLIYCIKHPQWGDVVTEAHRSGKASLVLSPWHFFEYGNARAHADTEDLIRFAEALQPKWTMERADLLMYEFWIEWENICNSGRDTVDPIGTFAEIIGILAKVDPSRTTGITIRDFVNAFSAETALKDIKAALKSQEEVTASNQKAYVEGRFTKSVRDQMERVHLAVQCARLQAGGSDPDRVYALARTILQKQPIATQLEYMVFWGFPSLLKCHQVEAAFTVELYQTGAKLSQNAFVDRQHATIALPYCDYFVTSDVKLINRCHRVKAMLPFATAQVLTGDAFIALLATLPKARH